MKRILLLMWVLLLGISIQAQTTTKEGNTITFSGYSAGDLATALAETDLSDVTKIVFSNCTLNADDFTALNSTTTEALSGVTTVDLSASTVESISTMKDMNLANMEYLRLPNNMTSADDVAEMKDLKKDSNNASLKIVGAYDPSPAYGADVAMHSFVANSVPAFLTEMNIPTSGNPDPVPRKIRMSGEYGDHDLVNDGTPTMGYGTSAIWDFTGAHFANCTIAQGQTKYYNYDDPFCDNGLTAPTTSSNSFCYFAQYRKQVVDIKLPDNNMTNLPASCLEDLAASNKEGYIALYGQDAFNANKVEDNCVPIETLVIPNCYINLEQECGMWARIRHLVIGSGVQHVHGGAFLKCDYLEDLDFAPGLSNCYLGDQAFNECKSMKHIALSEGIVSLGFKCFQNSQHLESIRLPETLKYIGNEAFQNDLALASITIPPNVVKIGKGAFVRTPMTDVYLTTTDPNKIPIIYTAGTGWVDNNEKDCTFGFDALWGFNTYPQRESDVSGLTWDEATAYYYANCNCMAVLHYPEQLRDRLWAGFDYSYTSSDGIGLPNQTDGTERGGTGGDLPYYNLGDANGGVFSRDGWAQFVLQKEFESGPESEVFTKEFDDVWYTICFPFDLTDEQLAVAFNEGYNIVDFSSIQVLDPEDPDTDPSIEKKTLVLHFNKVADTEYRDEKEQVYVRQLGEDGKPIRLADGDFEYNVYTGPDGETYKHVRVGTNGDRYKTKTFAINGDANNTIVMIDGYLASAGHPYMVHPNIGIAFGDPKSRCNFSGIKWIPESERASKYELRKRKIDLGEAKSTDNYNQEAYSGYEGQEYEFVGNWREYNPGVEIPTKPEMTVSKPTPPDKPLSEPIAVANPGPEPQNPGNVVLTQKDKTIYKRLTKGQDGNSGPWKNETEITANFNDGSAQWQSYNDNRWLLQNLYDDIKPYGNDTEQENTFIYCKDLFNRYKKVEIYKSWQTKNAAYQQYLIDQAYYDEWIADNGASLNQQYLDDLAEYEAALDYYNKNDLKTWKQNVANLEGFVVIPTNAYFLGRKAGEYPKYYREISTKTKRYTGLWTQYSAIIIPNDAAVAGLEAELDGKTAQAKGFNMAFDEDYFVYNNSPQGIATLVEKIEKEEGKAPNVEYMDIVVSIDGKIVSRDKTTFEGLPKGVYIINGKKYYVK